MHDNYIKSYGGEANWNKYLEWLEVNGAQEISFDPNGVPIFKFKSKYPGPRSPVGNSAK